MLSEEEQKAIEMKCIDILKNITREDLLNCWSGGDTEYNSIQTILKLIHKKNKEIERLQKENEILKRAFDKQTADMSNNLLELQQKDKQIDLMAEVMFKSNKAQLLIEYGIENKEQIIKEFEKLVKEKGE